MVNKFIEIETKTLVNISEIACIIPIKSTDSVNSENIIGLTVILKTGERINSSYLSKYEELKKILKESENDRT